MIDSKQTVKRHPDKSPRTSPHGRGHHILAARKSDSFGCLLVVPDAVCTVPAQVGLYYHRNIDSEMWREAAGEFRQALQCVLNTEGRSVSVIGELRHDAARFLKHYVQDYEACWFMPVRACSCKRLSSVRRWFSIIWMHTSPSTVAVAA